MTKDIKSETTALKETTKERLDEKKANMDTLKTAKEGLEAVNEAILILRSFYKQAAKAILMWAIFKVIWVIVMATLGSSWYYIVS